MSDCATLSCAEKTKFKPGESTHSADTIFRKAFQHQKIKIHTEFRETNAILVYTLQAHSFRYIHFIVVVLTSVADIKLWWPGVYSTKKLGGLVPSK